MSGLIAEGRWRVPEGTDDWLTPRPILDALGRFDLDPCAAPGWPTAARHICRPDDGLHAAWDGRVWLNPPYSTARQWVAKLAGHGHGTALIFARTETAWFAEHVWRSATGILFVAGRLSFHRRGSRQARGHNAGAPSVLVAYGHADAVALRDSGIAGAYVPEWACPPAPDLPGLWDDSELATGRARITSE